jgi:hypothetical protein
LTKAKARHRSYNDKRMAEVERLDLDDDKNNPDGDTTKPQVDRAVARTFRAHLCNERCSRCGID